MLDVSRFVFVRRIVVGKFSFGDVKRAYFWHLPMLESIVVDDGAFCARRTAGNEYVGTVSTLPEEAAEGSVLYIGCCNQLKEVTIGHELLHGVHHVACGGFGWVADLMHRVSRAEVVADRARGGADAGRADEQSQFLQRERADAGTAAFAGAFGAGRLRLPQREEVEVVEWA